MKHRYKHHNYIPCSVVSQNNTHYSQWTVCCTVIFHMFELFFKKIALLFYYCFNCNNAVDVGKTPLDVNN